MRRYHLCVPIDGDSMTVSAGGGWSSPVGEDRGGRGSDRLRNSTVLSHLSGASNSPKLLSTGGPIIVDREGLRYVGTIAGDEDNDEKQVNWHYGGTANKEKSNNKNNNQIKKDTFEEISVGHQNEVREFINKGGNVVADGIATNIQNQFMVAVNRELCSVFRKGDELHVQRRSGDEHFRMGKRARQNIEQQAREKLTHFLNAQHAIREDRLPAVFTLHGIATTPSAVSAPAQFAIAGGGGIALTEDGQGRLSKLLSDFWSSASSIATASTAGPITATLSLLTYSPKVGLGSDQVPGRDRTVMFSMPLRNLPGVTLPDNLVELAVRNEKVDLPIRATFVERNGRLALNVFKTGTASVPAGVKVLTATRDSVTGTSRVDIQGLPTRIVLESPARPPSVQTGHTGHPLPNLNIPQHTGTLARPVERLSITTTPIPEPVLFDDYIIWTPSEKESGVEPVYVVFSNPYGGTVKGKYSGRYYDPDKAGGPILDLNWRDAKIDRDGVDKVKLHTGRFGELADNNVMIERLEKILTGELEVTETNKRFYTHEIRELERYRALGVPDGTVPDNRSNAWNNAHTATLEDFKINENIESFYTEEAHQAYLDAEGGRG